MNQQTRDRVFLSALIIGSLVIVVVAYGMLTQGFGIGVYEEDPRVETAAPAER